MKLRKRQRQDGNVRWKLQDLEIRPCNNIFVIGHLTISNLAGGSLVEGTLIAGTLIAGT